MNRLTRFQKRAYSLEDFGRHVKDAGIGGLRGLLNFVSPGTAEAWDLTRQTKPKEEPSTLSKYKGTIGGSIGSALAGGGTTAYLSKENKLRNAILVGLLSGILGGSAGYAYDSGLLNKWLGKDK